MGTIAEIVDPETGKVKTKNLPIGGTRSTGTTVGTTTNSALANTPSGWLRDDAAAWGTSSQEYYNAVLGKINSGASSGSSGGSGGGGGGGSSATSTTVRGWFQWYAGSVPGIASTADAENWTEQDVINWCLKNGKEGTGILILKDNIRKAAAPFYEGDPSGIPESLVDTLIQKGLWTSEGQSYLTNTYFPQLKGIGATNPLASGYMEVWTSLVGNRPPGSTALAKMQQIINAYGFSEEGLAAWESWVKTTESAYYGDFGAEARAAITSTFTSLLGRNPTAEEIAYGSTYWQMATSGSAAALEESVMQSPEGRVLYANKPAWEKPGDYLDRLRSIDATLRWYYGDNISVGSDGSVTFNIGQPNLANPITPSLGVPTIPTYTRQETTTPQWKSLTNAQWASDLKQYGITYENGVYTKDGQVISADNVLSYLPENVYYRDESGFHYVQEEGAIDPRTGKPTTGPTIPRSTSSAPTTSATTTAPSLIGLYGNLGIRYGSVVEAIAADPTIDGQTLAKMFEWQEEAAYMSGIYSETLNEAFGSTAGIDWYKMASGAQGSGAMRAKLVEAQNRVQFREAYRQVFGSDPSPADYDRITSEFVSPTELIREYQAIESADEMYEEVNDLLTRVYGDGVTKEELKDMALGRQNSGELKALINKATTLDQYRWVHKQYCGTEPTPADYAEYAGYSGPAELQWEIVTNEKISEMRDVVNEALTKSGMDPFSDDELRTLYGEMEGYGELRAKVTEATKKAKEIEDAEAWMYNGAEQAEQAYRLSEQGGFRLSGTGIADL